MRSDVLLVGLGNMGRAYADVLRALRVPVIAIGRSAVGAASFTDHTGARAFSGGLIAWLEAGGTPPETAIVCVSIEETPTAVRSLLKAGVRRLLVEKPGAQSAAELSALSEYASGYNAAVVLAYNRRFYASVAEAQHRIVSEGGVESFHFEFTEREKDANPNKFSDTILRSWGLANSSHVIDLAFFLGGRPVELSAYRSGELPWHPSGARFAGSGRSETGALFSYCANWTSGGRWSVEVMTQESRLVLKPLERLSVQRRGSFEITEVPLDNRLDIEFKPGLYRQTEAFLGGDESRFVFLKEHAKRSTSTWASITGEGLPA